jgi:hypothetical protein
MIEFSEKDYLQIRFADFFEQYGYEPFWEFDQLRKKFHSGFAAIQIRPTFYERSLMLEVKVGIRFYKVEEMVKEWYLGKHLSNHQTFKK